MSRDDPLIEAAKGGDADAWRELYRAHAGRLVRWLQRHPAGSESAEDLGAEAWLTAASRIADFHGSSDDFAGWLFGIARNLESNARRKDQRRATDPTETIEAPPLPGHDVAIASEDWVRHTLSQLSDRERDVLTCQEVLGLDTAATAAALNLNAGAVRVARLRGLRRLRTLADPQPA